VTVCRENGDSFSYFNPKNANGSAGVRRVLQSCCGEETLAPVLPKHVATTTPPHRTMTYWASASDPIVGGRPSCGYPPCANWSYGSSDWEERLALLSKHRENVTGIIPCIHAVVDGGTLGSNTEGSYKSVCPASLASSLSPPWPCSRVLGHALL
jgi:hypothetical protein